MSTKTKEKKLRVHLCLDPKLMHDIDFVSKGYNLGRQEFIRMILSNAVDHGLKEFDDEKRRQNEEDNKIKIIKKEN